MSKGREGSDHRPNSQLPSDAVTGNVSSVTLPAVISLGGNRKGVSTCGHASRRYLYTWRTKSKFWCRGPESNWLRPPFQGGALPMSYPGFIELFNFRDDTRWCQFGFARSPPPCASSLRQIARSARKNFSSSAPQCQAPVLQ